MRANGTLTIRPNWAVLTAVMPVYSVLAYIYLHYIDREEWSSEHRVRAVIAYALLSCGALTLLMYLLHPLVVAVPLFITSLWLGCSSKARN